MSSLPIDRVGLLRRRSARSVALLTAAVALLLPARAGATRGIGIEKAERVIEARYPNIEIAISHCQRLRAWTDCFVTATFEETTGTATNSSPLSWTVRLYVRGHRLLVVELD